MNSLGFRLAKEEDAALLAALHNAYIPGGRVSAQMEPFTAENRRAWLAQHDPSRRPCWIAEQEGQAVGMVSLSDFHPRKAYAITAEVSIYLQPEALGRGLGSKLLAFAEQQAPALGIENLVGLIYDSNEASLRLFEKAGYERWGFLPRVARHPEGERALVLVGKRLMP